MPLPKAAWRRPVVLVLAVIIVAGAAWLRFGVKKWHESGSAVPTSSTMIFPAEDFPVGSVTLVESGRFYLVRVSPSEFRALYWRDPHSGCVIPWSPPENPGKFHDPCTGSVFRFDGDKLAGPSSRHLDRFPVTVADGEVRVNPGTLFLGNVRMGPPGRPGGWHLSIDEGTAIRKAEKSLRQAPDQDRYEARRVKLVSSGDLRRMIRGNSSLIDLNEVDIRKLPRPDDTPVWIIIFDRKDVREPYLRFDRWVIVDTLYGIVVGSHAGPSKQNEAFLRAASLSQGVPPEKLEVLHIATARFPLTGREARVAEVRNKETHQMYSVALDSEGKSVDVEGWLEEERHVYEARYGKIDPELYEILTLVGPDELIPVMIRFKAEQRAAEQRASELQARGRRVLHVDEMAPVITVELTKEEIMALSRRPDVDEIYAEGTNEPE